MVFDGTEDYFPTAYDTIYKFKYEGFAIQSTARTDELENVHEPLIVPAAHLAGRETVAKLIGRPEPVVLVGRQEFLEEFAPKGVSFKDSRLMVLILNSGAEPADKTYMPQADRIVSLSGKRNAAAEFAIPAEFRSPPEQLSDLAQLHRHFMEVLARDIYNEARKDWMLKVLDRLTGGKFPVVALNQQNLMALTRRKADGSTILAVFNLNFDPLKVPDIRCAVKPGKTEILGADGVWCKAETSYPGDVLTVNIGLQCYEAVVLKLR